MKISQAGFRRNKKFMCGFIGCIHDHPRIIDEKWKETFQEMNDIITHREL